MNALPIALAKLRAVERLYKGAVSSFVDVREKIETGIEPFEPPPFDPETDNLEPPFLEEWQEAEEFQDLIGQMCIGLVHSTLKDYLDGVIERHGLQSDIEKYVSRRRNQVTGESWFGRYLAFFGEVFGIDWSQSPVLVESLEEINLARNDIQHGESALGLMNSEG